MTNKIPNSNNPNSKKYDLLERTAKLGEEIIDFAKSIKKDEITRP